MKLQILLICLFFNSCLTSKIEKVTDVTDIYFGNGGGVTGEVIEYRLNPKGEIFKKEMKIKTLDSKTTLEIFKKTDKIKDTKFRDSGNMYSFLKINRNEESNRITWNLTSTGIDQKIKDLHNELIILTTSTN